MNLKILIADDHQIIRDGLRSLISSQSDMEVVGEAANGREAVQLAKELNPHLVIIDISMPDLNGIEATRQILSDNPQTRIIGLSMHKDKRFVGGMLEAGAKGYLLKHCAFKELAHAIRIVATDRTYLSPDIAGVIVQDYLNHRKPKTSPIATPLSDREREVLQLIAEGKDTKAIAATLHVSVKTVDTHRRRMMERLNIDSIAGLIKYAIREGITSLEN